MRFSNKVRTILTVFACVASLGLQDMSRTHAASLAPTATCPSTLLFGEVFTCSITAGATDSYTFQANTNDPFTFHILRTSGNLVPSVKLIDPNNNTINTCSTWNNVQVDIDCTVTNSGEFTLQVSDLNNNTRTGNYSVFAQKLNDPTGAQPVVFGELYTGSLGATIKSDAYTFSADANDQVEFRVLRTKGTFAPSISVYDTNGQSICSTWNTSLIVIRPPACAIKAAGTYYVFIEDLHDQATGDYQWTMQRWGRPITATTLIPGQVYTGQTATTISTAVYTFTADLNDQFILRTQRTKGTIQPQMRVYDASGASACSTWGNTLAVFEPCSIDTAGVYTLLIDDINVDATGEFTLHTQRINNPGATRTLGFGQTVTGSIAQPAALDTFTFDAQTNDVVSLDMKRTAGTFQPHIRVFNSGGKFVCGTWNNSEVHIDNCAIDSSGRYTVITDDINIQAVGNYTLALGCISGSCLQTTQSRIYLPVVKR